MNAARVGAVAFVVSGVAGCAELPPYPDGCGNSIVEAGEDCDGAFAGAGVCRAAGTEGACRFDCSEGLACPSGYGCGADAICRRPSGAFAPGPRVEGAGILLSAVEIDADGRADLLRSSPDRFSIDWFGAGRDVAATETVAGNHPRVTVADLNGDAVPEVAARRFVDGTVAIFQTDDRELFPLVYSATIIVDSFLLLMEAFPGNASDEFVYLVNRGVGVLGEAGESFAISAQPTPILEIAGVVAADVNEDPSAACEELLVARLAAEHVPVHTPCRAALDGSTQLNLLDAGHVTFPGISLPSDAGIFNASPTGIGARPALSTGDSNGDGHLDVVVSTFAGPHVAYGVGDGTFHSDGAAVPASDGDGAAVPLMFTYVSGPGGTVRTQVAPLDAPLAIADFNGDGAADFVMADTVLISERAGGEVYHWSSMWLEASQALAMDLNANGVADFVVTTAPFTGVGQLQFYNGLGDGTFVGAEIVAPQPIAAMTSGDFDGDLVGDLVLVTPSASMEETGAAGHLSVSYGSPFGIPEAARSIGTFEHVVQLLGGRVGDGDGADDVVVTTRQARGLTMAVLPGSADRELLSPIRLVGPEGPEPVLEGPCAARVEATDARALAVFAVPPTGGETATWLLGFDPTGHLATKRTVLSTSFPGAPAAVDLDGDGIDELVAGDADLRIFSLEGGVYVARPEVLALAALPIVVPLVVDADGDGRADVTVRTGGGDVTVLWNDGTGTLGAAGVTTLVAPFPPATSDPGPSLFTVYPIAWIQTDADPELELALVTPVEGVAIHDLDPRKRAFVSTRFVAAVPGLTHGAAAGDFDGDGVEDLAIGDEISHQILWGVPEVP